LKKKLKFLKKLKKKQILKVKKNLTAQKKIQKSKNPQLNVFRDVTDGFAKNLLLKTAIFLMTEMPLIRRFWQN